MESFFRCLSIIMFFLISISVCGPHSHSHKTAKDDTSKERIDDGAYSPRDQFHYKDGEHRSEFDHEAVLGSKDKAEEFDHLSPVEAKQRLKVLADKMDQNHDKYVDRKELIEWILRSFRMLTEEEALEQLEDSDGNEDGKVSWEEHITETYGLFNDDDDERIIPHNDLGESKAMKSDEELFKAADIDGDGFLSKKEYPMFSHPEEFEQMHRVLYEQTMKKRDKDNDNFLSMEEFVADSYEKAPIPNTEHYLIEQERFTNDYDQNGDGKLDKDEVLLWLIPDNNEMAESEADHLIESSDTNKDGKLSIEEVLEHHEIFVGSEATDFGEHLHNAHKFKDEL